MDTVGRSITVDDDDTRAADPRPDRDEQGQLSPNVDVDHFRVLRLLGRGGFGEVYLARDMRLGRKVALKLVSPRIFDSHQATEQFLFEARATARFSHPNIITIYDVGSYKGAPYVALEYLPGETLAERIERQAPSLRESLRMGLAIAEALAEAHRHGIVHRDLKPHNMLIPPDGRLRLFDFGLAKRIESTEPALAPRESMLNILEPDVDQRHRTDTGHLRGTPDYMAPEQWLMQQPTGATDVWALGLVLFELICGDPPYAGLAITALATNVCSPDPMPPLPVSRRRRTPTGNTVRRPVPEDLRQLVADCLQKDPAQRPPATEVARRIERLVYRRRQFADEGGGPFRGLLPFTERYADFFFGREAEIAEVLERLRRQAVLPVVGPSGAGKTSFIEAGVVPRLREQAGWTVLAMRPGRQPFARLASRALAISESPLAAARSRKGELRSGTGPADPSPGGGPPHARIQRLRRELTEELEAQPGRLALLLDELANQTNTRILLFVDQLEELYTIVDDRKIRRRFMEALCGAADDPRDPVRVIFNLRDDFLGRLAEGTIVRGSLSRLMVMRSPAREALEETVRKPVTVLGYSFEDAELVKTMVDEVAGEPACLPLLQFATRVLWEQRDAQRKMLLRRSYEQMGGVAGALAEHADSVLAGLSTEQVATARELLLMLVTPSGTRRVTPRARITEALGSAAEPVLDRLVSARLIALTQGDSEGQHEAQLELAHESLIHRWGRLARWIEENRGELVFLDDLSQAAALWAKRGRRPEELWYGRALHEALRVADGTDRPVPPRVHAFLDAAQQRARKQRLRSRLLQLVGVLVLAAIAVGTSVVALVLADKERIARRQQRVAEQQRERARRRSADAQRESAYSALLRGHLPEARAKLRSALEAADSLWARTLWWQLQHRPLRWRRTFGRTLHAIAVTRAADTVAVAGEDRAIYLCDTTTGAHRLMRGHADQVSALRFSPDDGLLASGSWSGELVLWDPDERKLVRRLKGHRLKVTALRFSSDGKRLVSASYDGTVRVWDPATGELKAELQAGERVLSVAVARGAALLAAGTRDGRLHLWTLPEKKHTAQRVHRGRVAVALARGGDLLATAGGDGRVRIWRVAGLHTLRTLHGHRGEVFAVAFGPRGKLLASAGEDATIRLWDARSGTERQILRGHRGRVHHIAFSDQPHLLVSLGIDRTARMWDSRRPRLKQAVGHDDRVLGLAISPLGDRAASAGWDETIRLWKLPDGAPDGQLSGHDASVFSVAFSRDGKLLASGSWDRTVRVWDVEQRRTVRVLHGHSREVSAVAFGRDDETLASASWDGTVRLWHLSGRSQSNRELGHATAVYDVNFSPDGRALATGAADGVLRIWSSRSGRLRRELAGHQGPIYGVRYTPDGRLISSGADGTVRLWKRNGKLERILGRHSGRVYHLDSSSDGRWAGSPGADGTARLWALDADTARILRGHRSEVNFLRFTPDGRYALTTSDDHTVRSWRVSDGMPYWRAPLMLGSPPQVLTHRGWRRLDSGKRPPRRERWARRARRLAVLGAASPDQRWVVLALADRHLERWDTKADRRRLRTQLAGVTRLVVAADGTLFALAKDALWIAPAGGRARSLVPSGVRAIGLDGRRGLLVATDRALQRRGLSGARATSTPIDAGASAVSRIDGKLLVGYRDGHISLAGDRDEAATFNPATGSSVGAVTRLLGGPRGTLVAGYADGSLVLWSMDTRQQLVALRLHGAITHLQLADGKLYAASELGDLRALDLRVFQLDYCALVRRVWKDVAASWERGRARSQPPPREHPCSR